MPAAAALGVGIALASLVSMRAWMPAIVALVGCLLAWWPRSRLDDDVGARRARAVGTLLVWLSVGALRQLDAAALRPDELASLVPERPHPVVAHGVMATDPSRLFDPDDPESARTIGVVDVRELLVGGAWRRAPGKLRVRLRGERHPALAYGDDVVLEGALSAIPLPGNPGQYDWRASLAREQIVGQLIVGPIDGVVRLSTGGGWRLLRWAGRVRARCGALIDARFDPRRAALLQSLLLGQRANLDDALKRAFVETGTVHLLVISGFNVGLIAALLEFALRFAGLPLGGRVTISSAALLGYCAITGMQPPVERATVMAWVVLAAVWLDRIVSWPNTLAASALVLLVWQPQQLMDPSFQLSFGAVASLLLFSMIAPWLERMLRRLPERAAKFLASSVGATIAVWIGLWPVLAWYFQLLSPISILANLVLVPLVSVLVGVGTVVLALGLAWQPLFVALGPALAALLRLTVAAVQGCHALGGAWPVGRPAAALVVGYYTLVALSLLRRRLRLSLGAIVAAWLLGIDGWLAAGVIAHARESATLELTALDVGHGDCLAVRAPRHQRLLVDAGSEQAGASVVVPYLRQRGWRTLDALVLTHPDEDHIGGALPLLAAVRIRQLFTNGSLSTTPTGRRVLALARAQGAREEIVWAGMRLTKPGAVDIIVLHPPRGLVPGVAPRANENSIVLQVRDGDTTALLTGDLEEAGVPWLLGWGDRLWSTVLKVPHHGSALGRWDRPLLHQVRPKLAVVSVGWLHRLPAAVTIRDLHDEAGRVVLTRDVGAVTIVTDGRRACVRTFRQDQGYCIDSDDAK